MNTQDELKVGSVVEYYKNGKYINDGIITCVDDSDDFTVYDVELDDGRTFWGYRHQFKIYRH